MKKDELFKFLEQKVKEYNRPSFITDDPILIPHSFSKKQDIEIAGFFAAVFAWGQRTTIIQKSKQLMDLMDNSPYQFCKEHTRVDLEKLISFRHRTFNDTDLLYFISFLHHHYKKSNSLETAFTRHGKTAYDMLSGFHDYFFSLDDFPSRTRKHVATPARNSSCKRLNMYLRWMVRNDGKGVDFGIWKNISASELICPLDLHVGRVARRLKLLKRKQDDWQSAVELTGYLKKFDPSDPVKYDIALFALGVTEKF